MYYDTEWKRKGVYKQFFSFSHFSKRTQKFARYIFEEVIKNVYIMSASLFFFNCGRFQMIVLRTRILQHCQLHDCPVDIVLYICSLNTLSFSVRLWVPRFILKILSYSYILIEGDLWLVLLCVLEDFTACEKIYILCFPN